MSDEARRQDAYDPAPHTSPLMLGALSQGGGTQAFQEGIAAGLARVETLLNRTARDDDSFIDATCRHLIEAGGKRARPLLVLLSAHLGDAEREAVTTAAVSVELIHLATLYHDDVMDEAPVRRGAPAAQEVWGNSVAILAGDILFSRASLLSASLGTEAATLQAQTFERLVQGQLREFQGPGPGDDPVEFYLGVLADKTGSLIAACGEFGVLSSGADRRYIAPLREYGEKVGVAFQLADDIIDLTSDGSITGKTPGTDLREGVPTLPGLLVRAAAGAGDADAARVVALLDADLSSDAALEEARAALAAHPATTEATEVAGR